MVRFLIGSITISGITDTIADVRKSRDAINKPFLLPMASLTIPLDIHLIMHPILALETTNPKRELEVVSSRPKGRTKK